MGFNTIIKKDVKIEFDDDLHDRTLGLNKDHIKSIAEAIGHRKTIKRPRVMKVTDRDDKLYAIDWHRIKAYLSLGKAVPVVQLEGTWQDARDLVLSANLENHSLPLTPDDKRRKVRMALTDHWDWTDTRIAKGTGTSHWLVMDERKEMIKSGERDITKVNTPRVGQDGKTYNFTQKSAPETANSPEKSEDTLQTLQRDVKGYFNPKRRREDHEFGYLLSAIVNLATKISQACNDSENNQKLRQYLLAVRFVLPRDTIIDGKHFGWQCIGLRGLYRAINLAGTRGNRTDAQVLAEFEAALRGE